MTGFGSAHSPSAASPAGEAGGERDSGLMAFGVEVPALSDDHVCSEFDQVAGRGLSGLDAIGDQDLVLREGRAGHERQQEQAGREAGERSASIQGDLAARPRRLTIGHGGSTRVTI